MKPETETKTPPQPLARPDAPPDLSPEEASQAPEHANFYRVSKGPAPALRVGFCHAALSARYFVLSRWARLGLSIVYAERRALWHLPAAVALKIAYWPIRDMSAAAVQLVLLAMGVELWHPEIGRWRRD